MTHKVALFTFSTRATDDRYAELRDFLKKKERERVDSKSCFCLALLEGKKENECFWAYRTEWNYYSLELEMGICGITIFRHKPLHSEEVGGLGI